MSVAFVGQGSLQPGGLAFTGKGAMVSQDASLALTLIGFEAPPSAGGRSTEIALRARQARPRRRSKSITGAIAGEDGRRQRPISTSAAPRRASRCRAAPAPSRCRRCSACWWRGTARPRPRRCSARSARRCPRSGRRAASRLARSKMPKARSRSRPIRCPSAPTLKVQGATLAASVGKDGLVGHRPQGPSVRRRVCRLRQPVAARQRRRARPRAPNSRAASSRSFARGRHRIEPRQGSVRSRLHRSGRGLEPARPGRRAERAGHALAWRRRAPVAVAEPLRRRGRDGRQEDHQGRQGRDRRRSQERAREDHQGHLQIRAGPICLRHQERHACASPRRR